MAASDDDATATTMPRTLTGISRYVSCLSISPNVCVTAAGDPSKWAMASNNVLVGGNAGRMITNGSGNVAVGTDAGGTLTTGASNVFVGDSSGFWAVLSLSLSLWIHTHTHTYPL